jgi:hypothetical protein
MNDLNIEDRKIVVEVDVRHYRIVEAALNWLRIFHNIGLS